MSLYDSVKTSKLRLKGDSDKSKKKHKHKKRHGAGTSGSDEARANADDMTKHGGWWSLNKFDEISGSVAIEFGVQTYVKALDNGLFTVGAPHDEGDGPAPEEILTAIKVNETKIALKSGYDKYLRVEKTGVVTGRSDAIGPMEQWEPVFQDGKLALLGYNNCFLSVRDDDDNIIAESRQVGPGEILKIRSQLQRQSVKRKEGPEEEDGDVKDVEINYVRKFQKFQDKKLRLNSGGLEVLKSAKNEGTFHETLLDRRSKMKSDRYCK